jgi:hypothetical protein
LPPPETTGTTVQSFTDVNGDIWIAKNGVNGGVYRRARDVLHCRVYRSAAWTPTASLQKLIWDTAVKNDYGIWTGAGNFSVPIGGWYGFNLNVAATASAPPFTLSMNLQLSATRIGYLATNGLATPAEPTAAVGFADTYFANAGDVFFIQLSCALSGGTIAGGTGLDLCHMGIAYLGSG